MSSKSEYNFLEDGIESFEFYHKAALENNFGLLKMLPQLVFKIDLGDRFIFLNDSGFKILKHNKDYQKEFFLRDIIAPESIEDFKSYINAEAKDEYFCTKDFTVLLFDGSRSYFTIHLKKILKDNIITGYIGIGIDTTDRKLLEIKNRDSNDSKMKLFSIISHDLKNPFNTIVGFSNLIMMNPEKYSKEKILHFVSHIHGSAQQTYSLLENLLEWSRAKSGTIQFTPHLFNIILVLEETLELFISVIEKNEIEITRDLPKEALVFADKNMVMTVIRNLISNAIKFTNHGGRVEIFLTQKDNFVSLSVKDNGIGIEKNRLISLFTLETNLSMPGTDNEKGTGLGLILCKEFMSLNSGSIVADSVSDEGSTFTISLPGKNAFQTQN